MSSVPAVAENTSFRVGLTQEERELYSRLFKSLDPQGSGIVTGEKARVTFEKSGLPPNILGEIWQLADSQNLGFLTQFGFCHAMRLIGYTQAGHFPTAQLAETPGPLPKFADFSAPPAPLHTQTTSGSLLQAQPSAIVPQNTATQQSVPQAPVAVVSPADYEKFAQMYVKTTGSQTAILDGNAAKSILMKAKLPTATLGQIWSLVDVNNRGFLDLPAFVMAMHLIHGLLSGSLRQLPPFLPEHVWRSVDVPARNPTLGDRQTSYSSVNSQSSTVRHPVASQVQSRVPTTAAPATTTNANASATSEWNVTPAQKQQFDAIFDSLDKARTGTLAADQVASFLMTSRLDQQDLATVWDLSDIQNTGVFGKLEFGIALFLINRRRSGLALPDVVPEELIDSLSQGSSSAGAVPEQPIQQSGPAPAPAPAPVAKAAAPPQPKSSLDELADIFGSPSPAPPISTSLTQGSPQNATIQPRASSSDLTHSQVPPKVRQHLTSSFKPSSTFGQSLLATRPAQPTSQSHDLIGEDVPSERQIQSTSQDRPQSPAAFPSQPSNADLSTERKAPEPVQTRQPTVDYEALRSVPKPPQARSTNISSPGPDQRVYSSDFAAPQAPPANGTRNFSTPQENNDLLADSEVSGKLSEATSDIANFSTQIKSLSAQTSNLNEKKLRAEQELTRILTVKEEINTKLKSLRTSYESEVKQVEQVESNLNNAREELEALRSEASIAEAKFNSISNEFHEKQLAVEETQKVNSSLKEKLGNLNAEIAALESDHQTKAAEQVRLSNEANVRKSQAQVALVKVDELKQKIAEVERSHESYTKEIEDFENQKLAAEREASELEKKHQGLSKGVDELKSKHSILAGGVGATAGVAAGVALGAGISSLAQKGGEGKKDLESDRVKETPPPVAQSKSIDVGKSREIASSEDKEDQTPTSGRQDDVSPPTDPISFSVPAIVDEVKQNPAEDLTGLDDVKHTEHKDLSFEEEENLKERFPPVPLTYENSGSLNNDYSHPAFEENISKRASTSSAATGSYKHTEGGETGETPITTPSNSEYRFHSNAGVVGGMVGMPGVLVGVQRTDSLTSSVQNNPSMSVRDDNIDEISDRDTLEDTAAFSEHPSGDHKQSEGRFEESSEGERLSSGVESFEIVNADEAKGIETTRSPQRPQEGPTHPLSQSYRASELSSGSGSQPVEEFPSPKELDYDESSSDESERHVGAHDKFDDANDKFRSQTHSPSELDLESEFNDLKPATNEGEKGEFQDEFFDEDFDNLKLADDDNQDEVDTHDVSIDDHFTGADEFSGFAHQSSAPDFATPVAGAAHSENDEWEQLFAGFGNAPTTSESQAPGAVGGNNSHELAVQELVAMGFEKPTVVEALERENYDVEAATNYLLDHA